MKTPLLLRKIHYWGSILVALPLLVVICTGLLLQAKKWAPWIQPGEQRAAGEPAVSMAQLLEIARSVPQARVQTWADIYRVDMRPKYGVIKIIAANRWEIQADAHSGAVLQVAYRRSDFIEALHDGSWFGGAVRYGVFVPAGVALLGLWATGMYLFVLPIWAKRRARHRQLFEVPQD